MLAVAMLVIAGTALAYWKASGSGTGSGAVGSLNAPTAVSATAGIGTAHVSWTASTTAGGRPAPTGYYVRRWSGALPTAAGGNCGTPAAPVNQTSCDDAGIADGTYTYTVVAVYHSWTAESTHSSPVTVVNDVTAPTSSITFPASGSRQNAAGWGAGCSPAGVCGSASDSGAGATGVSQVQANIQRASDSRYWNASTSTWVVGLVWNTASGTTSWNLALAAVEPHRRRRLHGSVARDRRREQHAVARDVEQLHLRHDGADGDERHARRSRTARTRPVRSCP